MQKMIKRASARGQQMRDRALAEAMKRKEEYLGARVPRELKSRVIARAAELDIPVSLLLRKVLEDIFGEQKSTHEVAVARYNSHRYAAVLGWKELELNRNQHCDCCNAELVARDMAIMGVTADDGIIIICGACKQKITT